MAKQKQIEIKKSVHNAFFLQNKNKITLIVGKHISDTWYNNLTSFY